MDLYRIYTACTHYKTQRFTIALVLLSFITHAQVVLPADSISTITKPQKTTYYIEAGSYGTKRETDPPSYVRNLALVTGNQSLHWLDAGLDYRGRSEYQRNDIRRPESINKDYPVLLKGRFYIGIRNIIDPLRVVAEFQDSDKVNSDYVPDNREVNKREIIQGFAELNFKNLLQKDDLGNNRPVMLRFGRMAFEFLDRRLIAQNGWRNTTNNFDGFRVAVGQDSNDWQVDVIAVRPVIRYIDKPDRPDNSREFGAVIGHWRKWSDIVTIEPYYMTLRQNNLTGLRHIHSPGIRAYGWVNQSGFNYDASAAYQFGKDGALKQEAYLITAEVGYKLKEHTWKPRFSVFLGHISGDKDPNDNVSNRFERFFGVARPWSANDYIIPENISALRFRVEAEPFKGVRGDAGYSFYKLASKTDRFNSLLAGSAPNRDITGRSGDFLGHELELRILFKPLYFIDAHLGYSHFTTGEFVHERQDAANGVHAASSDFVYLELTLNMLDLIKRRAETK